MEAVTAFAVKRPLALEPALLVAHPVRRFGGAVEVRAVEVVTLEPVYHLVEHLCQQFPGLRVTRLLVYLLLSLMNNNYNYQDLVHYLTNNDYNNYQYFN